MALSRQQKYLILGAVAAVIALLALARFIIIVAAIETAPVISVSKDGDEMTQGYTMVKPTATQDDVIGLMGSQFQVLKCPPDSPATCAHIWHFESGGQAWEFTFDVDGNLMKKDIATAGE